MRLVWREGNRVIVEPKEGIWCYGDLEKDQIACFSARPRLEDFLPRSGIQCALHPDCRHCNAVRAFLKREEERQPAKLFEAIKANAYRTWGISG